MKELIGIVGLEAWQAAAIRERVDMPVVAHQVLPRYYGAGWATFHGRQPQPAYVARCQNDLPRHLR